MSGSPGNPNEGATPPRDKSAEVTATDLVVPLPEYLREIEGMLERAVQAYGRGDLGEATRWADEGLAALRLTRPHLKADDVPPHYEAFFHCLRIQPQFRQALALYKQAALGLGGEAVVAAYRQAWAILEPAVAGLADNLSSESLVYDYPVAGRVLRGVYRLRQKLHTLVGSSGLPG
jgi:hypothetical protein